MDKNLFHCPSCVLSIYIITSKYQRSSNKIQRKQEPKRSIQHKLLMKNINFRSLMSAHFYLSMCTNRSTMPLFRVLQQSTYFEYFDFLLIHYNTSAKVNYQPSAGLMHISISFRTPRLPVPTYSVQSDAPRSYLLL